MNYASLVTEIQSYTENEFVTTDINTFITQAEQRIYNGVQLAYLRKNTTGTLTSGNKYLSLPSDWLDVFSLAVIDGDGLYSYLLNKDVNFIGKEALIKIKDKKQTKKFVMLALENSKPGEPLLLHDEPIYLEDTIIGRTTSGNYSFNFEKNLAFGYVNLEHDLEHLIDKNLYIEVEKKKYNAILLSKPLNTKDIKSN